MAWFSASAAKTKLLNNRPARSLAQKYSKLKDRFRPPQKSSAPQFDNYDKMVIKNNLWENGKNPLPPPPPPPFSQARPGIEDVKGRQPSQWPETTDTKGIFNRPVVLLDDIRMPTANGAGNLESYMSTNFKKGQSFDSLNHLSLANIHKFSPADIHDTLRFSAGAQSGNPADIIALLKDHNVQFSYL
jgi:hypothetical protein